MASALSDQELTKYLREMQKNPANDTVCFLGHVANRLESLEKENRRLTLLLYSSVEDVSLPISM